MKLIFATRIDENGQSEDGIFLSLSEFAGYRRDGWSSTPEINEAADQLLCEEATNG